jgi:hypothetical protein
MIKNMGNAWLAERKRKIGDEEMREAGIDTDRIVREDREVPDFPDNRSGVIFFQRAPPEYIRKHANDKFSMKGRKRMSFKERLDLPSWNADSVKAMYGPEAWVKSKELLKAAFKGDTDVFADFASEAFRRGGQVGHGGRQNRRF